MSKTPGGQNQPDSKAALVVLLALVTMAFGVHTRWLYLKSLPVAASDTSTWLQEVAGPKLAAYALIFAPFVAVLSVVVVLLVQQGLPKVWDSVRRSAPLGLLLGACLFGAALLASGKLSWFTTRHWLFFVPIVPPVLL